MNAEQIADVALQAGFPNDEKKLQTAVAVALAESGGDPAVVSSTGDVGIWQINLAAHPQYPADKLKDPLYNAGAMVAISANGTNWKPWFAYTTGRHLTKWGEAGVGVRRARAVRQYVSGPEGADVDAVNKAGNLINTLNPLNVLNDFLSMLNSSEFWNRVVKVIAGLALLIAGLLFLNRDLVMKAAGAVTPVGRVISAAT